MVCAFSWEKENSFFSHIYQYKCTCFTKHSYREKVCVCVCMFNIYQTRKIMIVARKGEYMMCSYRNVVKVSFCLPYRWVTSMKCIRLLNKNVHVLSIERDIHTILLKHLFSYVCEWMCRLWKHTYVIFRFLFFSHFFTL